jgi:hypothetical protein
MITGKNSSRGRKIDISHLHTIKMSTMIRKKMIMTLVIFQLTLSTKQVRKVKISNLLKDQSKAKIK